jgi:hypothetical protein
MWSPSNRYYLATAVARTPSITVHAKDERKRAVELDVEALKLATASTEVSVEGSSDVGITYSGTRPLAFGVELMELSFQGENGAVTLAVPDEAVTIRSGERVIAPDLARQFIGTSDDDAFVALA